MSNRFAGRNLSCILALTHTRATAQVAASSKRTLRDPGEQHVRRSYTLNSSSGEMQQCISNCTKCHQTCTETLAYCLKKGGQHAAADHIKLLVDCAESCGSCADFMLRQSDFHMKTCGICAEICAACAKSCERMGQDEQMKTCAAACRACAESCQKMSGNAKAA